MTRSLRNIDTSIRTLKRNRTGINEFFVITAAIGFIAYGSDRSEEIWRPRTVRITSTITDHVHMRALSEVLAAHKKRGDP